MSKPKVTTDTVKVSRLGCMRKSTVVKTDDDKTVEHVEVWVPADKDKKARRKHRCERNNLPALSESIQS